MRTPCFRPTPPNQASSAGDGLLPLALTAALFARGLVPQECDAVWRDAVVVVLFFLVLNFLLVPTMGINVVIVVVLVVIIIMR